jgi:hypothetical protein
MVEKMGTWKAGQWDVRPVDMMVDMTVDSMAGK